MRIPWTDDRTSSCPANYRISLTQRNASLYGDHHSIIEFEGKWYLFYHDVQLSGETHLRNVKVTELAYNDDGTIQTIDAYTSPI